MYNIDLDGLCKSKYSDDTRYWSEADDLDAIDVAHTVAGTALGVVIGHFIPPEAEYTLRDDSFQRIDCDDFFQRVEKENPETWGGVIGVVITFFKDPETLETVREIIEPEKLKTARERGELVEEIISTMDGLGKDPYGLKDDKYGKLANKIGEAVVEEVANCIENINTSEILKEKLHEEEYHKLEEINKNQQKKHPTTTLTEKKWRHFWKK